MQVAVIDYGAGNLESVRNMLWLAGAEPVMAHDPESVLAAERLVLPGVGAAGTALAQLRERGMDEALEEAVRRRGRPMLGICLGMQMVAERLFEFGEHRGLGWLKGDVRHLKEVVGPQRRVPHIGWNRVQPVGKPAGLLARLNGSEEFYFCHAFTLLTADSRAIAGTAEYGAELIAAVCFDSVFATQFHPEKSQLAGRRLMEAFLAWRP